MGSISPAELMPLHPLRIALISGIGERVNCSTNLYYREPGTANLTLAPVEVGGIDASDFSVNPQSPPVIAPGRSRHLQVSFSTTSIGPRPATLEHPDE